MVWRGIAVWDKKNSRPQMGRFKNQCEFIVWGSNGALPPNKDIGCLPGVFQCVNVRTSKRFHQTEKPIELLEKLLQICKPGGTVLDPFMGSGSTGVACVNTGRDFIGIELDQGYFETACRRIADAQVQIRMEAAL